MTVSATLDLSAAAGRIWDAVVVGAGPAGAMAARELARRRAAVLLVDKAQFPRPKVCGCCLNMSALATLEHVGLGTLPARHGAVPLHSLKLAMKGRQATLRLPGGMALSRQTFDAALVRQALIAGADFLPQTQAIACTTNDSTRQLRVRGLGQDACLRARVVLIASGLGGRLGGDDDSPPELAPDSRLGASTMTENAPDSYQKGIIYMACAAAGYVGLVRVEDGRLDIAAALEPALVQRLGLGGAAEAILDDAGLPAVRGLASLNWRGTPLLTRRASRLASQRMFLLGDAAGYVEPFTGEGMAWALGSGIAAAALAKEATLRWNPGLARRWSGHYHRTVGRRQRACRIVTRVLRLPVVMQHVVGLLGLWPRLATPLIRYLNTPWPMLPRTPEAADEPRYPGTGNGVARDHDHAKRGGGSRQSRLLQHG